MSDLILFLVVTALWLGVGYLLGRASGHAEGYEAGRAVKIRHDRLTK